MLAATRRGLFLQSLGRTKLGAEVLAQTRTEMRELNKKPNFVTRFLTRRRPIDYLAIEIDGPVTKKLHPSFYYAKLGFNVLLCGPVLFLLLSGTLQPTYYLLVSTGLVTPKQYEGMWALANWALVLAGQLLLFVIFYDLSVYIRYPFFAHVLAPLYRHFHWVRPEPVASYGAQQLRTGTVPRVAARPLGRPLHEVKREASTRRQQQQAHPFGKPHK